ncbi:MAG: sensor histidine kinase [Vicinamibacterales bacterium]
MQRYWHWIGATIGVAIGVAEVAVLSLAGVRMTRGGADVDLPVAGLFELSFGVVGYLVGRLMQTRATLRADAATIRRQLEEIERTRALALHHERMAALGRLAAGIAHEVRNPLGVIRSCASMIQEAMTSDADAARACQFIQEESIRLDGFIATLLTFAKPTTLRVRPCDLQAVVVRALELSTESARRTGAGVTHAIEDPVAFTADPDLVVQVVLGLVVNALEAAGAGGRVAVSAHADDVHVAVRVADDGPGLSAEARARLFEPFFTTKSGGTGLGLSVAAQVVTAHGGTLRHEDRGGLGPDGRGACFVVSLPRHSIGETAA